MILWPLAALLLCLSGADANKHFRAAPPQVHFPECRPWLIEGHISQGEFPLEVSTGEDHVSGLMLYTPLCEDGAPILDLTQFRKQRAPYIFALFLDAKVLANKNPGPDPSHLFEMEEGEDGDAEALQSIDPSTHMPKWINHHGPAPWQEPFEQSVVVISLVAASSVAVVWILTLVAWTQMHVRSWIMLISITAAAATLTVAFAIMVSATRKDFYHGILDAGGVVDALSGITRSDDIIGRGSLAVAIVHYLSGVIIYAAELECLLRAFSDRINERRVAMWGGTGLAIGAKTLWAIYVFVPVDSVQDNEALTSVTVAAYLLETAVSVLFACSLFAFGVGHATTAYSSLTLPLGVLVHALSLVPFAAFITDLALPEDTRWMWYVRVASESACVVLLWMWMDRIDEQATEDEEGAILGRRVFPEENQTFTGRGYVTGGGKAVSESSRSTDTTLHQAVSHPVSQTTSHHVTYNTNPNAYVYEEDKVRATIMRFLPPKLHFNRPDTGSSGISGDTAYVAIRSPERTFQYAATGTPINTPPNDNITHNTNNNVSPNDDPPTRHFNAALIEPRVV
ncbi:pH-response regulator protein palH/RIM21 [Yarrowia sp. C11]|nr:pH-response regulator protein palH/RIM21 [Yarrowia sp. E02]KAG5373041.1 pH-response regulator protein palH/RIM21 [Yarrowia sp. C11]